MKSQADLEALRRELTGRIKVLTADNVFMDNPRGPITLRALQERLKVIELIIKNVGLIDWLVNPNTDVKRTSLINQDLI